MRIMNAIKTFFKRLLSRKKREPISGQLSEKLKTFYDIEVLENAQANSYYQQIFCENRIPKAGEGKEVHFVPYKNLSVEIKES